MSFARALEEIGLGDFAQRFVGFEEAVRAVAARMHDSLGNPLVIEMKDLLAEVEVFESRGPRAPIRSEF